MSFEEVEAFCRELFQRGVTIPGSPHGGGELHHVGGQFGRNAQIGFNSSRVRCAFRAQPITLFTTSRAEMEEDEDGNERVVECTGRPGVPKRRSNGLCLYCSFDAANMVRENILRRLPELSGKVGAALDLGDAVPNEVEQLTIKQFSTRVPIVRRRLIFVAAKSGRPKDQRFLWFNKPRK